jgi:hypothetical protein
MKSSTYASLVIIVFLQHRNAMSRSIESVIRTTDQLCKKLGYHHNLSHMTKYRIISDLIESKILTARKTKKNIKITLSYRIHSIL